MPRCELPGVAQQVLEHGADQLRVGPGDEARRDVHDDVARGVSLAQLGDERRCSPHASARHAGIVRSGATRPCGRATASSHQVRGHWPTHTIVDRQELTKRDLISLTIEAPQIARKIRPGQFVVLRVNDTGERVPLTVAYRDAANGTVTIIFQVVGKSTAMLASLGVGDAIKDLCGPLGKAEHIEKIGTVLGIGGGSGIAVLHHLLTGHRDAGNHIIGVVGARQKDLLILEHEMGALCDELIVTTDDGSYGVHGKVTDALGRAGRAARAHRQRHRRRAARS